MGDGDVLGQRPAVDQEQRHLGLGVEGQILGRALLALLERDRPRLEGDARLIEGDVGHERAGAR